MICKTEWTKGSLWTLVTIQEWFDHSWILKSVHAIWKALVAGRLTAANVVNFGTRIVLNSMASSRTTIISLSISSVPFVLLPQCQQLNSLMNPPACHVTTQKYNEMPTVTLKIAQLHRGYVILKESPHSERLAYGIIPIKTKCPLSARWVFIWTALRINF